MHCILFQYNPSLLRLHMLILKKYMHNCRTLPCRVHSGGPNNFFLFLVTGNSFETKFFL